MLRKTRVALAFVCIVLVTLLFLDFTGTARYAFGWLAKIQFWPAVLALNIGVILALLVLTFLFGRVYCSIICPFGIFQDVISRISGRFNKRRFRYSPAFSWLRYTVLAIFVGAFSVSSFVVGAGVARAFVSLLSPYSAYGRIANGLFAPVYRVGNNLLAHFAERIDSYAFYSVDVIGYKGVMILVVPLVTLVVLAVLAWRNGRTYCNTICPVGTVLGFVFDYLLLHAVGLGGMEALKGRYLDNGMLDFLLKEREAGHIRNLGFSYHGDIEVFDYLLSQHDEYKWDFVQIQLNYVDWKHAKEVNPSNTNAEYLCGELKKRNIPSIIMEPLLGGRLATLNGLSTELLRSMDPEASTASWAFRFAGSEPNVLTVLSGMTYMEHLQENIRTYSPIRTLNDEERAMLEEVALTMLKYPLIQCNACQCCMPCPYGLDIPDN